ncbi:MAG: hypothetical protein IT353_24265 [Gemmatimonadaceae bacterium]|nr:hypothetical protein [Gemmatimonadaceae bacterium]
MRSLVLLAAFLAPSVLSAQSNPLVGTWKVVVPVGMKITGGEPEYLTTPGLLTVTATPDSLIATMKLEPLEGRPARPASRLAARFTTGKVTFTSVSTAQVSINGDATPSTSTSTYVFEATGDVLSGTVSRDIPGVAGMGAQPIKGTRTAP